MEPSHQLTQLLNQHFKFESFKPGQQDVIQKVLNGKSASAIFPTGSGKSLCYQLPALQLPNLTLVISPLLSLMKDQLDFLLKHGINAARLDSTLDRNDYNQVLQQAKNGVLKILMISVERFKNERFRAQLHQMQISMMVVDEAHCISEWGHNFRPDYLKLPQYQKEFSIGQCLLLTATATPQVINDMKEKFNIRSEDVVITGFYRSNLKLIMNPHDSSERLSQLHQRLQNKAKDATIIYVTLQKTAETVATYLNQNNLQAQHYHAGMKPEIREQIQNQFMQGEVNCIVATIAFGMGIDKTDVRRVIHYDLPKSIENYAQEIGRSGRDGETASCEILANNDSLQVQENFVYGDTPELSAIKQLLDQIKTCQNQNSYESYWETKLTSLSNELNIRPLPLKTLLVYLELENIITPKFTYFEEYAFRSIQNTEELINLFQGERKTFIQALFAHCIVKKTWTYVDIQAIMDNYNADRSRILKALDWLDDQGHLDLQAKLAVERFDVTANNLDTEVLSQRMHQLFLNKEENEIKRIHNMITLFESDHCISKQLAMYFGDQDAPDHCGHCSVCLDESVSFKSNNELSALTSVNFEALTKDFQNTIGDAMSAHNITKFLCGIHTPIFTRLKVRALPHFGSLELYNFQSVKNWANEHMK